MRSPMLDEVAQATASDVTTGTLQPCLLKQRCQKAHIDWDTNDVGNFIKLFQALIGDITRSERGAKYPCVPPDGACRRDNSRAHNQKLSARTSTKHCWSGIQHNLHAFFSDYTTHIQNYLFPGCSKISANAGWIKFEIKFIGSVPLE